MKRYTTPTLTLTVKGVDITDANIYVTLQQKSVTLTKSGDEVTATYANSKTTVTTTLTQEETALFSTATKCNIQVNWIDSDGYRGATNIKSIYVRKNLLDSEVEYSE